MRARRLYTLLDVVAPPSDDPLERLKNEIVEELNLIVVAEMARLERRILKGLRKK